METNLSRSGTSHPDGKMLERPTIPMPEKLFKDAEFAARAHKQNFAQYVRESLAIRLYGELQVIEDRVASLRFNQCDECQTSDR